MMDPWNECYFVLGAQGWERRTCGKSTPLPEKEKKADVTDKYKTSVP